METLIHRAFHVLAISSLWKLPSLEQYFVLHSTKKVLIFVLSRSLHTKTSVIMNIENTQSQMRKGILEFCILSVIRRGEAYPSDIVEEMKSANLNILEGTLYPLLSRLKNADMLTYRWVESNSGPPRKYFSLTPKGEAFYGELEATWNELANAVNALASKKTEPGENQTF
jgi:PadR family transcriptional regulator, regulatory protein PadR